MKKYAMILLEKVIDVLESAEPPVYPPDPDENEITAVECGDNIQLGDKYKDGEFILVGDRIVPVKPDPTQLDRLEEQQLITMEATATIYEAILALGSEK